MPPKSSKKAAKRKAPSVSSSSSSTRQPKSRAKISNAANTKSKKVKTISTDANGNELKNGGEVDVGGEEEKVRMRKDSSNDIPFEADEKNAPPPAESDDTSSSSPSPPPLPSKCPPSLHLCEHHWIPFPSPPPPPSSSSSSSASSPYRGEVLTFGTGDCSQLGFGPEESDRERKAPSVVGAALSNLSVVYASAGALHNGVITADGDVYTWGCNDDSACGRGGDEWYPGKVEGICRLVEEKGKAKRSAKKSSPSSSLRATEPLRVAMLASGASHTLALTDEGFVFGWGLYRENNGAIGFSPDGSIAKVPQWVSSLKSPAVHIAVGEEHDVVLLQNGDIYQWGDIGIGQRSSNRTHEKTKGQKLVPRKVTIKLAKKQKKPEFVSVWAGGHSSFALTAEGDVWAWGPNNYNQLGVKNDGEEKSEGLIVKQLPVIVEGFSNVKKVSAGSHHTLFLTKDGQVYSTGRGHFGRLGHGDESHISFPKRIAALDFKAMGIDDDVIDIACGEAHSLVSTRRGKLFTFGYGDLMQLGNGGDRDELKPYEVKGKALREGRRVLQVTAGTQHSMVMAVIDSQQRDGKDSNNQREEKKVSALTVNANAPSPTVAPLPSPSPSPRADVVMMQAADHEAAAADLPPDSDDEGKDNDDDELPAVTEDDEIAAKKAEEAMRTMNHSME